MMSNNWHVPIERSCVCYALRYRLERAPIFVNCCNCHQCQRETGSAFALNAMVEHEQVTLLPGKAGEKLQPKYFLMPSESGMGQLIARCPRCFVAAWSFYCGAGPFLKFVRASTLLRQSIDGTSIEDALQPDIFIYTKFKQPWVVYPNMSGPDDERVMEEFYNPREKWSKDGFDRFEELKPKLEEWKKQGSKWEDFFPAIEGCR